MNLASIGHFLQRMVNCYRFFTPYYWRMRAHRDDVACAMQVLLPKPYDPYEIELKSRSIDQATGFGAGSWEDDSWNPVFEKLSAKALDRRLATIGAVEIGSWAVEDVHSAFASIDQDVIAAVALRTREVIDSFSNLSQELAPHTIAARIKSAFTSVDTHDLAHNTLIGSAGEAAVLRHLHEAGVDSHLAPHLNTRGWDLTWSGNDHLVNVKTWKDVSDLSSHFGSYPEIPAVVPIDASGIPEHALHFDPATSSGLHTIHDALESGNHGMVIVDHALSGEAIHEQLQHAETLATHGNKVVHGHLPYVTMALSGFREFDLLLQGKTDFATAAMNASLDAMGTGVGGATGAKAGAVLGTILLPGFGTLIGGIAGGIFGAFKGREFTSEIKQRPFKEAVTSYESALAQFQSQARIHEAEASSEFNKARIEQELRLEKCACEVRRRVEEATYALDTWIIYDCLLQPNEACVLIFQSSNEITQLRTSIQTRYVSIAWWKKYLWPDVETLAQKEALAFLRRIEWKLGVLHCMAGNGETINRGQLMALLGTAGVMHEQVAAGLEKIYAAQRERDEQAKSILSESLADILHERREAEVQLSKKLEALRTTIREAMRAALTNLNKRVEHARLEGAKLGLNL